MGGDLSIGKKLPREEGGGKRFLYDKIRDQGALFAISISKI